MGTLTIPNSFTAGTTIVAGDMNANFTAVKNYVEGDVLQESTATAKGDIYVASSSGVVTKLAVGSNTQVLTADSSTATGLAWAAAPAEMRQKCRLLAVLLLALSLLMALAPLF